MWNTEAQQDDQQHASSNHHSQHQNQHQNQHHQEQQQQQQQHSHHQQAQHQYHQHSLSQSSGPHDEQCSSDTPRPSSRDASSAQPIHLSHSIPENDDDIAGYEEAHSVSPQYTRRLPSQFPSHPEEVPGTSAELEARTRDLDLDDRPPNDGQESSHESADAKPSSPEPSKAMQVPTSTASHPNPAYSMQPEIIDGLSDAISPSGPPASSYYGILQRPPWMPLPIGDADTAPGSPIVPESDSNAQPLIDDAELASVPPLDNPDTADDKAIARPTVTESSEQLDSGNQEDDEMEDELDSYPQTGSEAVVPTTIEWHGHGDNVFVTGTFVGWGRKFRLRPNEDDPNVMSVVLKLREGTHHLKFIVDNVMRTSYRLPTAVDFTNHLVNYIEVVPPEPRGSTAHPHAPQASSAPAAADTIAPRDGAADKSGIPNVNADALPPNVTSADIAASTTEPAPYEKRTSVTDQTPIPEEDEDLQPMTDTRVLIPQLLEDIDVDEDTPSYQQAANVISEMTTPPTLPLFLAKSILNGHTPAKDDNSVLNYPNHTVLNHLATSSIKNGVLATSVTTRYKRKVSTFISPSPLFSCFWIIHR